MIDINYYRAYENKAKDNLSSWIFSQKYNLDIFEKVGFPVRINNIQQSRQIFDTMQENRFTRFMNEISGFTDEELEMFIASCIKSIEFQSEFFPQDEIYIPFDSLMNTFVTFSKINAFKPNCERIFEIGPGSGSFSFHLKNFSHLKEYSYTDACESFYMLQNNINFFLFKNLFTQHVLEKNTPEYFIDNNTNYLQGGFEKRFYVNTKTEDSSISCNAYPWWKLGKFDGTSEKYDVITSNANLNEFNEGALNDYLAIINNKLNNDGIVFAHCTGSVHGNHNIQYLFNKLYANKFAIICMLRGDNSYTCSQSNIHIKKIFTLDNLIFVGEKHPLFHKYYKPYDVSITSRIFPQEEFIHSVLFPSYNKLQEKKIYTKDQLHKIIVQRLA